MENYFNYVDTWGYHTYTRAVTYTPILQILYIINVIEFDNVGKK